MHFFFICQAFGPLGLETKSILMQFSSLHVSFPQLDLFNNVCTDSYALNRRSKVLITLHWGNSAKARLATSRPQEFLRERSEYFRSWNGRALYEVARGRPSSFVILNQTKETLLNVHKSYNTKIVHLSD